MKRAAGNLFRRMLFQPVGGAEDAAMGYIPPDARWYLADVILEHIVEGDSRNVVHVNTYLVEAESPERAHERALALGRDNEREYPNTDGKTVRVRFRGLRELNVIHDALEDGVELAYSETVDVPEEKLRRWISPKEQLGVFAPIVPKTGAPNYMPESVMRMLEASGFSREDVLGGAEPDATDDGPG
jgi:hypothetical protein